MQKLIATTGRLALTAIVGFALCHDARADQRQQKASEEGPSRSELLAEIRTLADRVKQLEERIQQLENPASVQNSSHTKARPSRTSSNNPAPAVPKCEPPYTVDATGFRHFIPECIEGNQMQTCDDPFVIDQSGIKHVKVACLSQ